MRVITERQYMRLIGKEGGSRRSSISKRIRSLEAGKGLFIKKSEWSLKTRPSALCCQISRSVRKHSPQAAPRYKSREVAEGYALLRVQ